MGGAPRQARQRRLADAPLLEKTIKEFAPQAVIHFAASIQVEESVREPLRYYRNNVANTLSLLDALASNRVNHFVYSSTAAVYGVPEKMPVTRMSPSTLSTPTGPPR